MTELHRATSTRLARSAGDSPAEARARSLVAWMAGRRETDDLKPVDNAIFRMVASHRAVTKVNAQVAPKSDFRRPSPRCRGEGSMDGRKLADAYGRSGGVVATAWWQGRTEQLEKPSSSRREIGGAR